jgi:hypothetical protein
MLFCGREDSFQDSYFQNLFFISKQNYSRGLHPRHRSSCVKVFRKPRPTANQSVKQGDRHCAFDSNLIAHSTAFPKVQKRFHGTDGLCQLWHFFVSSSSSSSLYSLQISSSNSRRSSFSPRKDLLRSFRRRSFSQKDLQQSCAPRVGRMQT